VVADADPISSRRFAHSPALWREDTAIAGMLDRLTATPGLASFFYMSLGTKENTEMTAGSSARGRVEARARRAALARRPAPGGAREQRRWATAGFTTYRG
jgi:hypothetical protein